jgi:hypothetical protein
MKTLANIGKGADKGEVHCDVRKAETFAKL